MCVGPSRGMCSSHQPMHLYSCLCFLANFCTVFLFFYSLFSFCQIKVLLFLLLPLRIYPVFREGPHFYSAIALTDIPHLFPTSLPSTESVVTWTARSRAKGPTDPPRAPIPNMHPPWNSGPPRLISLASLVHRAPLRVQLHSMLWPVSI